MLDTTSDSSSKFSPNKLVSNVFRFVLWLYCSSADDNDDDDNDDVKSFQTSTKSTERILSLKKRDSSGSVATPIVSCSILLGVLVIDSALNTKHFNIILEIWNKIE